MPEAIFCSLHQTRNVQEMVTLPGHQPDKLVEADVAITILSIRNNVWEILLHFILIKIKTGLFVWEESSFFWYICSHDDDTMVLLILNLIDDIDHVFQFLIRRGPTKCAHHLIFCQTLYFRLSKVAGPLYGLANQNTSWILETIFFIIKFFGFFQRWSWLKS